MALNVTVAFLILLTLPIEVDGVGGFFWGSSSDGKKDTGSENNSPGMTFSKKKASDGPTISDSNGDNSDDWRSKIGVNMRSKSSASGVDDSHLYISEVITFDIKLYVIDFFSKSSSMFRYFVYSFISVLKSAERSDFSAARISTTSTTSTHFKFIVQPSLQYYIVWILL